MSTNACTVNQISIWHSENLCSRNDRAGSGGEGTTPVQNNSLHVGSGYILSQDGWKSLLQLERSYFLNIFFILYPRDLSTRWKVEVNEGLRLVISVATKTAQRRNRKHFNRKTHKLPCTLTSDTMVQNERSKRIKI